MRKTPADIMRDVRCELTPIEAAVLSACDRAARSGSPIHQVDIAAAAGSSALWGGTAPGILKRLETKGYITRSVYQRGVQVCIVSTGQCTSPPANTAPHWRARTEAVATPAIQAVRERSQSTFMQMEEDARKRGKAMSQHLADLVYIGHHAYRDEQERGE